MAAPAASRFTLTYFTRSRTTTPYTTSVACVLALLVLTHSQWIEAADPERYDIGRQASPAEIASWNIDVKPNGEGLPVAQGNALQGKELYDAQCAQCHGVEGIGGPFGTLVGRLPDDAFPFGRDPGVAKTIGNYWPYATTLFDYIRRAMPFDAPGSLSNKDVYSLVTYLLQENDIIEPGTLLNQHNLATIRMPARDRFVPDDRRGGNEIR
jgi:cytochrome c